MPEPPSPGGDRDVVRRVTYPTMLVLDALLRDVTYGYQIAKETGLNPATVYGILRRLELRGWAISVWDHHDDGGEVQGPLRHHYALLDPGRTHGMTLIIDRYGHLGIKPAGATTRKRKRR